MHKKINSLDKLYKVQSNTWKQADVNLKCGQIYIFFSPTKVNRSGWGMHFAFNQSINQLTAFKKIFSRPQSW